MCAVLRAGRDQGRRQNVVLVAEGAQDRDGKPITVGDVKRLLEEDSARTPGSRSWATSSAEVLRAPSTGI